jgi:hypothetical protein
METTKLTDYIFSGHSEQQLQMRFGKSSNEVMRSAKFFKKGSKSTRYSQVRNKLVSYPHQEVFYNERYNMILVCDTITKKIATAMFLQVA